MYSTITNKSKYKSNLDSAELLLRLVLYKDELYRLPQTCKGIRILSGHAWITVSGKDVALAQGEQLSFGSDKNFVLVSTLRNEPLIFEIWGNHNDYPDYLHLPPKKSDLQACPTAV